MSELDIIEVNENEYRINGVSNKTFPSRAAAKKYIEEENEKKRKEEEDAAAWEDLNKRAKNQNLNNSLSL
ncbi:hypothetical protein [Sulfurimonas sp. RIFOXYB12_FULL_35_9]|jgi:hypothetical protein|uniref:hypothetical protein n=1 Tax=Sulfurimonas sp. RIFOXYB12_FULL_35_9 TaxID=1802256 RepID=UPI0008D80E8D|nr:hypothetical protein [Sulfurimonas sp. RIFOXYB12_FULL_35_9]OHE05416.1 MAG: hypothetical protein A2345_01420 [Sulfurimonas sp. RIFOXYB12_FULL_35_9]